MVYFPAGTFLIVSCPPEGVSVFMHCASTTTLPMSETTERQICGWKTVDSVTLYLKTMSAAVDGGITANFSNLAGAKICKPGDARTECIAM